MEGIKSVATYLIFSKPCVIADVFRPGIGEKSPTPNAESAANLSPAETSSDSSKSVMPNWV